MQENKLHQSAGGKKQRGPLFKTLQRRLCQHPALERKEIKLSKQDTNQPLVFTRQIPRLVLICSDCGLQRAKEGVRPGEKFITFVTARATLHLRSTELQNCSGVWKTRLCGAPGLAGSARNRNSSTFAWNLFPASTLFSHSIVSRNRIGSLGTLKKTLKKHCSSVRAKGPEMHLFSVPYFSSHSHG